MDAAEDDMLDAGLTMAVDDIDIVSEDELFKQLEAVVVGDSMQTRKLHDSPAVRATLNGLYVGEGLFTGAVLQRTRAVAHRSVRAHVLAICVLQGCSFRKVDGPCHAVSVLGRKLLKLRE